MPIDISAEVRLTPRAPAPLTVTLPGGVELGAQHPSMSIPDGATLAKSLLAQANSAMAPLAPIFKVIDVALVVVEAIKAVPEMIVNPAKLVELIVDVVKKASALLSLLPPMSIPLLAVGLLDVLIAYLEGLVQMMRALAAEQARIDAMRAKLDDYPSLAVVITVSEENLDAQMESLEGGMGPIEKLIRLLNLLMQLAGLPEVPSLSSLGRDPTGAIAALEETVKTLRAVRSSIPV